jgi:hypothetical protein
MKIASKMINLKTKSLPLKEMWEDGYLYSEARILLRIKPTPRISFLDAALGTTVACEGTKIDELIVRMRPWHCSFSNDDLDWPTAYFPYPTPFDKLD